MLRRILLSLSLLILASGLAFSQGSITGVVKDAVSGEAIIGANVMIQGTAIGASTDVEGKFEISKVNAGTYNIQVSFITYKTNLVSNVVVEDAKRVNLEIPLAEESSTLQEVVIQAKRQTDTDFEMLRSIKESRLVVTGISSEQISKSLDRDAAQVLRRVPGITILDNQFVQIRGLATRYNVVMLHNAYAPSVETDVRSFSFAAIPSSQLDRILVFKSPSADLPGDFGGGVVKVYTKSVPDENSVVLDYSTQVRSGTTFGTFYHQQYDAAHATGINTGYYNLPANFPANLKNFSQATGDAYGQRLKNLWVPVKGTAIPDQRFTLTFNRKFYLGKVQVGNISAVNYSNSYSTFNVDRGIYSVSNGSLARLAGVKDNQYNQTIRSGLLFNWSFKLNNNHHIDFKNLYNLSSVDQYVDRQGTDNGNAFSKIYSGIYSGQLVGTHDLFNKQTSVEWVAGYNKSTREQPDFKRFFYSIDGATNQHLMNVPNAIDPNNLGKFYGSLNESAYSGGVSVKQRFAFTEDPLKSPELKAGIFFESKSRDFSARNLGYKWAGTPSQATRELPPSEFFSPSNINANGLSFGEDTKRKDSYTASNRLIAYYVTTSIPLNNFKIDVGVRAEDNHQKLNSFDDLRNQDAKPDLHVVSILPSANVSYNFSQKMLVRAAYGKTVNRPEFRELAPFGFYDFNYNFLYIGNQNLKNANIQNFDLRWEFYPSKNEQITFGGFYKDFKRSIEIHNDGNLGGLQQISFLNAKSATSYGVELEVKKSLKGIATSAFLDNLNVMFNATLIKSKVTQEDNGLTVYDEKNRPMQGQAPYVINAGVYYTSNSGWQVNALYNVVGKNIFVVGNEQTPSIYTMPRNIVDLVINKKIGERLQIKAGISDILNQPFGLRQAGANGKVNAHDDNVVQSLKPGRVFSLGFSLKAF